MASAKAKASESRAKSSSHGKAGETHGKAESHGKTTEKTGEARGKAGEAHGKTTSSQTRSSTSNLTTDHDFIRKWVESRGGHPAKVKGTGGKEDPGLLRIDFPGYSGAQSLEEISWDEFFDKFEESRLALLYQEKTKDGKKSNFNKLVSRH
jgi:hypothetical protein